MVMEGKETKMMSRLEQSQQSHVSVYCLQDPNSSKAIDMLWNLLTVCAGPFGKNHVIRNSCGGHVTLTSTCARLLSTMMISRPELKLVVSSVQAHIEQYGDCGLFMACVCLRLIKSSFEVALHFRALTSLYESFTQILTSYLDSADCEICVKVDFTILKVLVSYVKSVLFSKPVLNLSSNDADNLSVLVVRAFVESVPSESSIVHVPYSDGVHCVTVESQHVRACRLEKGLLLECPEVPSMQGTLSLTVKTVFGDADSGKSGECSKTSSFVKVSLFTCSLAGDVEETVNAHVEASEQAMQAAQDLVNDKLIELCDTLESCNVGLVLSQRVIHPKMKASLRSRGIYFVDRLGSHIIPYVQDLTGAQLVASIMDKDHVKNSLGRIDSVTHLVITDKSFLHLTRPDSNVVTLLLYSQWEERLVELKSCVKTCFKGLYNLHRDEKLLMGAGCWQVHCSHILREKVLKQLTSLAERLNCSEAVILQALMSFRSALHSWVFALSQMDNQEHLLMDPVSFHCWRVQKGQDSKHLGGKTLRCCCGLKEVGAENLGEFHHISRQETLSYSVIKPEMSNTLVVDNDLQAEIVLDSFSAATNALRQAVSTVNVLLSIGQVITDKN